MRPFRRLARRPNDPPIAGRSILGRGEKIEFISCARHETWLRFRGACRWEFQKVGAIRPEVFALARIGYTRLALIDIFAPNDGGYARRALSGRTAPLRRAVRKHLGFKAIALHLAAFRQIATTPRGRRTKIFGLSRAPQRPQARFPRAKSK